MPLLGSPRASLVISAHNEGELLWRSIESCINTTRDLRCEILVADDASTDGSVAEARRRFPRIRIVANRSRRGVSATKDLGARKARGKVIVFLDGHCKPERWAIERLVNDVEDLDGKAIVTPIVPALNPEDWQNSKRQIGYGYRMTLDSFEVAWISLKEMRQRKHLYENPALMGCCAAMTRQLYETLWGFDPDMVDWGVEDIDLGLKAWLLGYSILLNPSAPVGHRFRSSFDNFSVADHAVLVNQLRMAYKNFSGHIWEDWLEMRRSAHSKDEWESAWRHFSERRDSAVKEHRFLQANRAYDELWYAERFGLGWPHHAQKGASPSDSQPRAD